jgi:hypothetical protein
MDAVSLPRRSRMMGSQRFGLKPVMFAQRKIETAPVTLATLGA